MLDDVRLLIKMLPLAIGEKMMASLLGDVTNKAVIEKLMSKKRKRRRCRQRSLSFTVRGEDVIVICCQRGVKEFTIGD